MTSSLNVILGAGFSFYAGLPLAKRIDSFFDRDIRKKLLRHSSSEWQWIDDKDDATINNGQINWDYVSYSYILQDMVLEYKRLNDDEFPGYEHFFQYATDLLKEKQRVAEIYQTARAKFSADYPDLSEDSMHWEVFNRPQIDLLGDIINYLIADVLWWKKGDEELLTYYGVFLDQLRSYSKVNIFSLNHDLLLEHLLKLSGIDYSDGFTREHSKIFYKNEPQRVFLNAFLGSIKLHKLHGSIDSYKFPHGVVEGQVQTLNEEFTYFKADSYRAKHYAKRISETGETLQGFLVDVVPKFITGTDKASLMASDYMYSTLTSLMRDALSSNADLLICGYSFGDDHINRIIEESCSKHQPKVVNINPSQPFPYDSSDVQNINDIRNLNNLER